MPTPEKRISRKKSTSHRKSDAQKKHQERAKKAMTMFKTGKVSTLKKAWAKV